MPQVIPGVGVDTVVPLACENRQLVRGPLPCTVKPPHLNDESYTNEDPGTGKSKRHRIAPRPPPANQLPMCMWLSLRPNQPAGAGRCDAGR